MTGPELRTWRKGLGLTQPQAAEALGISLSRLGDFERGMDRGTGRPAPIPRAVALACAAITNMQEKDNAS